MGPHRFLLFLAFLGALFLGANPAAACGEDNQPACQRQVADCFRDDNGSTYIYCYYTNQLYCNYPSLEVDAGSNKNCVNRKKGAGLSCCTAVNYTDPYGFGPTPVTDGYYARVDLNAAWIIVPNQNYPNSCSYSPSSVYKNAVLSVPDWAKLGVYNARLMINANFFDPSSNPYYNTCNNALGLTVSNTSVVSPNGKVHNNPTASLIFFTPDQVSKRGINALIADDAYNTYGAQIQNAVSGFWLLKDGNFVTQPVEITPDYKRPRTAVGLSDGNTLYLIVVNPGFDDPHRPGATTLQGLAEYMKNQLHIVNALTLDGSGSSQLYYNDPDSKTTIVSKPSDDECPEVLGVNPCFRPVPVFLGIQ